MFMPQRIKAVSILRVLSSTAIKLQLRSPPPPDCGTGGGDKAEMRMNIVFFSAHTVTFLRFLPPSVVASTCPLPLSRAPKPSPLCPTQTTHQLCLIKQICKDFLCRRGPEGHEEGPGPGEVTFRLMVSGESLSKVCPATEHSAVLHNLVWPGGSTGGRSGL